MPAAGGSDELQSVLSEEPEKRLSHTAAPPAPSLHPLSKEVPSALLEPIYTLEGALSSPGDLQADRASVSPPGQFINPS